MVTERNARRAVTIAGPPRRCARLAALTAPGLTDANVIFSGSPGRGPPSQRLAPDDLSQTATMPEQRRPHHPPIAPALADATRPAWRAARPPADRISRGPAGWPWPARGGSFADEHRHSTDPARENQGKTDSETLLSRAMSALAGFWAACFSRRTAVPVPVGLRHPGSARPEWAGRTRAGATALSSWVLAGCRGRDSVSRRGLGSG
jgi:hypothetical protein